MRAVPTLALTALIVPGFVSCSSVKSTMQKVGDPMKSLAKLKFPGSGPETPPVVQVRRGDLRKIEFGREKALAWNRVSHSGLVSIPKDFDPGNLPSGGPSSATGILPPLDSGTEDPPAPTDELPDLSSADFAPGDDQ